jgi:hypothetical protein
MALAAGIKPARSAWESGTQLKIKNNCDWDDAF